MLPERFPLYLANQPQSPNADLEVLDKFTGTLATRVPLADAHIVAQAVDHAAAAFEHTRRMPGYQRQAVLSHVVTRLVARESEFAQALCIEVGKTIRDARAEVGRCIDTLRIAAEEAVRMTGEYLPLDISKRSECCEGILRRFPIGPCAFITPFNFPLNLVAHKVAPALAVGCPFILKPASRTPVSALLLGEILAETSLPQGAFSILPCTHEMADTLAVDDRIKFLSFTGSAEVGWALKAKAIRKKVALELGGNAACIVDCDADLDRAGERITFGAFYQSGQSCISVQRILAHRDVYDALRSRLIDRAKALVSGNPKEESTFLGPMISQSDAIRVERWVHEAVAAGGRLLCGGKRNGAFFDATLLENVDSRMKVSCAEVFGPVATLHPFDSFEKALRLANDSEFGLQAGVFTRNLDHAFLAFQELEVGGVIINDVPSFRVDSMPYGGVKNSGQGREGVRFAMEEMSEPRLMVLNNVGRTTAQP